MSVTGDRLRTLRKERGLTQEEFSKIIGIKRDRYAKYETGDSPVPSDLLKIMAKYFYVSTDFLLGLTDTTVERVSEAEPIFEVKDTRLPDVMTIKMKPTWKDKGLTPEKVERIIEQALAYNAIMEEKEKNK